MVNLVLVMDSGAKPITQEGRTLLPFFGGWDVRVYLPKKLFI